MTRADLILQGRVVGLVLAACGPVEKHLEATSGSLKKEGCDD